MGSMAQAYEESPQARYEDCLNLIDQNAEKAFDTAIEWRDFGGGDAAEHCAAAALLSLGHYKEAAQRLEELAQHPTDEAELRAGLLAQAAQGWLLGDEVERAYANLTAAINLVPTNALYYVDRGAVQSEMGAFDLALDDFSRAISMDPSMVDGFVFRGSAYRHLEKLDLALVDLNRAIELDRDQLEAYLERGIVYRLQGNSDAARKDWLEIILIAPGSEIAGDARRNLELMDVKNPD